MNLKRLKKMMDSKNQWWLGVEGAKLIWHGDWADAEVEHDGLLYSESNLTDAVWYGYEDYCKEQGIEATEEGFKNWDGLKEEAEQVLYDLYPKEVSKILHPEEFKVGIISVTDDEGKAPFKAGDVVTIDKVVEWVKSKKNSSVETFFVDDDCIDVQQTDDSEDPYFDIEIETYDTEWFPKAAGAMAYLFE